MYKFTFAIVFLSFTAFIGWYFGYISGAKNQIHFDAAARVSLYEKSLSLDDNKEVRQMLKGFLWKQKCLLASDFNYDTYTIKHPVHSDVLDYYDRNIKRICMNGDCECDQKLN